MSKKVTVKIHPPTAGVRILCIDGGGTRGALPLRIMKRLHERIDLPLPFQILFQIAFGISSGGLIVLAMFVNGWSIEESTDSFERLAKVSFMPRKVSKIPIFRSYIEFLISYFADRLFQ